MTSSFAASLRKLADEAVEAKRLAEERVREAQRLAKAEALRLANLEEARAREEARQARLQVEKEAREKAAEVERLRCQEEATRQAEQRSIEAERLRVEIEERRFREEAERARQCELRKVQLCSDIYGALAVAAWEGVHEVAVDQDAFHFRSDLLAMGIAVRSRNKLARFASNALAELLAGVDHFSRVAETSGDVGVSASLQTMAESLQKSGQPKFASQFSKFAEQQIELSVVGCDRVESIHQKLVEGVGAKERSIDVLEKKRAQLVTTTEEARQRAKQSAAVAARIKANVDKIGSSYQAQLPAAGTESYRTLSYGTKVAALRIAYRRLIHDVDFERFSALEIINLMRQANGQPPMEGLYLKRDDGREYFYQEDDDEDDCVTTLNARLAGMNSELSSSKTRLASTRYEIANALNDIRRANDLREKSHAFHNTCIQFERVLDRELEGVNSRQLRFCEGQYLGPTVASLHLSVPPSNAHLALAYAELRWLASEDGRDFAGYMDIVLSELAKEGVRGVDVSFIEGDNENRVEIGKVSLVCRICAPLMELLFSKRGIATDTKLGAEGQAEIRLSW